MKSNEEMTKTWGGGTPTLPCLESNRQSQLDNCIKIVGNFLYANMLLFIEGELDYSYHQLNQTSTNNLLQWYENMLICLNIKYKFSSFSSKSRQIHKLCILFRPEQSGMCECSSQYRLWSNNFANSSFKFVI